VNEDLFFAFRRGPEVFRQVFRVPAVIRDMESSQSGEGVDLERRLYSPTSTGDSFFPFRSSHFSAYS